MTATRANVPITVHLLQIVQPPLHEAEQFSIFNLVSQGTINSCGDGYKLLQIKQFLFATTNILNILKLIMNQLKIKQHQQQTNKNFNCIHVRNKYILNQNRIQFTVWIYEIQPSVNFCNDNQWKISYVVISQIKMIKNWNLLIKPPKRTKLVKLGLKTLLRFKITKCRWIYGLW